MHSDWFNVTEILQGRWQHGEKWDTVIPADLKRLFVSGTYMSRWSRKGSILFSSVRLILGNSPGTVSVSSNDGMEPYLNLPSDQFLN
jgi:hypothetical protein